MNRSDGGDGERRGWRSGLIILITIIIVMVLVLISYIDRDWPEWTGFSSVTEKIDNQNGQVTVEYQRQKTLWDLLDLLIVPAILAGGAYWLQQSDKRREQYRQEQQAQETTLQSYLDKMTDLLVKERILNAQLADPERSVLRSRTLTTLRMLDGVRKGIVVRFLYESGLITGVNPFIDLNEANLNHTYLSRADLQRVNLHRVKLEQANLSETNLTKAKLREANLSAANLMGAILHGAELSSSNLSRARLTGARFHIGEFTKKELDQLPPDQSAIRRFTGIMIPFYESMNTTWDNFGEGTLKTFRDSKEREVKRLQDKLAQIERAEDVFLREGRNPHTVMAQEIMNSMDESLHESEELHRKVDEVLARPEREKSDVYRKVEKERLEVILQLQEAERELGTYIRVDMREANLEGADLRGADLRWADLRKANLRNADLREALLLNADLSNANLTGADLSNAILSGATIKGEQIEQAKSKNRAWRDGKYL